MFGLRVKSRMSSPVVSNEKTTKAKGYEPYSVSALAHEEQRSQRDASGQPKNSADDHTDSNVQQQQQFFRGVLHSAGPMTLRVSEAKCYNRCMRCQNNFTRKLL